MHEYKKAELLAAKLRSAINVQTKNRRRKSTSENRQAKIDKLKSSDEALTQQQAHAPHNAAKLARPRCALSS